MEDVAEERVTGAAVGKVDHEGSPAGSSEDGDENEETDLVRAFSRCEANRRAPGTSFRPEGKADSARKGSASESGGDGGARCGDVGRVGRDGEVAELELDSMSSRTTVGTSARFSPPWVTSGRWSR